jgi:putative copper resistance protein D
MRTGSELVIELLSYMTHVLAAGAWIGGLLPLASLLASRGSRPGDAHASECREALLRFSNVGILLVSLILLSGLANSVFRLKFLSDLFATPYGFVILAKALLFGLMLIAAAVNRWRLVPRLECGGRKKRRFSRFVATSRSSKGLPSSCSASPRSSAPWRRVREGA